MPTYEYSCKKCNEKFEARRTIGDETEVKCPKCGSTETERVYFTFDQSENVDMSMASRPT